MSNTRNWLGLIASIAFSLASPLGVSAQARIAPASPVIVLLDGRELAIETIAVTDGKLTGKGLEQQLPLEDVRQIRLRPAGANAASKSGIRVDFVGAGNLIASQVTIADDHCTVSTATAGKLKLPIDVIRSIAFDPAALPADYHQALETPSADNDRLFIKAGDKVEGIAGLIESLDEKEIKFDVEGKVATQPRDKLLGVVVARAIAGDDLPPCTVAMSDGGALGGELVSIADANVVLKVGGNEITLPMKSVRNITLRSSKMAYLSDLKPTAAEQQSIVTLAKPWQRDRSYSGKPLQLGERVFEKGIGAHSRSELTFALEGKYETLAAVVGIDAATEEKGDCVMSVLADGAPLWTGRVRGSDPPRELSLKVKGVNALTLLVEPGEELDLADHANWADARVIRAAK